MSKMLEDLAEVVAEITPRSPGGPWAAANFIRTHHVEILRNAEDAKRLDWLEKVAAKGWCPAVINDDFGHWAFSDSGMQEACEKPSSTTFFLDEEAWKPSLREAIDNAMKESK